MDPLTVTFAIVALLSEILPLIGVTKVNGILHGLKHFVLHLHGESDCHVTVDVDT
jgi:beta-glucosidase-like glycosyl hydrolase